MAYGGNNFGQFMSVMLGLREQRLKEQLEEEEMKIQAMQQLGKGIGSMFSSAGSIMQNSARDRMANQLMNEGNITPPRAEAVNVPWSDERAATMAPFSTTHTGGMDELALRMKMMDMKNEQMRARAYQQQVEQAQAQREVTNARNAWLDLNSVDTTLDKKLKARTAYIKDMGIIDKAMMSSEDPQAYDAARERKIALNQAAIDAGMKGVDPIDPTSLPTWSQREAIKTQQATLQEAQEALKAAQQAPMSWSESLLPDAMLPMLGMQTQADAIKAAQEKFEQEQKVLKEMSGSAPTEPAVKAAATGATSADSGIPVGHKQVNPTTGRTREWDGEKWIYR